MTATIIPSHKGFNHLIDYIFKKSKTPEIITSNEIYSTNPKDIKTEFLVQKHQNQNIKTKNWYHHISISFSPKDAIKEQDLQMYVKEFLQELYLQSKKHHPKEFIDFSDCQYIAVAHHDKKHKHIHLIINRVQLTTNSKNQHTLSRDKQIKINTMMSCYTIAKRHNLELDKIKTSKEKKLKSNTNKGYKPVYQTANSEKFNRTKTKENRNTNLKLKNYDILYKSLEEETIDDFFKYLEKHTEMKFQVSEKSHKKYLEATQGNKTIYNTNQIDELFNYLNIKTKFQITDKAIKNSLSNKHSSNSKKASLRIAIKESTDIETLKEKLSRNNLKLDKAYLKEEKIKQADIENYYIQRKKLPSASRPYFFFETYENEKKKLKEQIGEGLSNSDNNNLNRFQSYLKRTYNVKVIFKKDRNGNVVNAIFINENDNQFKGSLIDYKFSGKKIISQLGKQIKK